MSPAIVAIPLLLLIAAAAFLAAQRSGHLVSFNSTSSDIQRLLYRYTPFRSTTSVAYASPTDVQLYHAAADRPLFVYWYDADRCQLSGSSSSNNRERCRNLYRTYETFATRASERDLPVRIMSIDCKLYRAECDAMDVTSFPTLSWYRDGEAVDVKSPALKPRMDWNAVTVDALWGYARKKIDEGSCTLYNLVGEGAEKKRQQQLAAAGRGDRELSPPNTKEPPSR